MGAIIMGTNTIADVADATIADATDLNQYKTALVQDQYPRNVSGAITDIEGSLGSSSYRWLNAFIKKIYIGESASNNSMEEDASGNPIIKRNGVTVATFGTAGSEPLGTVISSILTVAQFQTIKGTSWVLMDGSSIAGSDLDTLTSIATLPNIVNGGALIQTDTDGNIGNLSIGQNLSHTHTYTKSQNGGGASVQGGGTYSGPAGSSTGSDGGTDNLAAGVKMNLFIKINN